MVGIGTITYFAWPKKETEKESKEPVNLEEKIQQLRSELISLRSKLNNISDTTKKTQLENKLTNFENQIKNFPNQDNSLQQSIIQQLEHDVKEFKKQIENGDNPEPQPGNKGFNYVSTKINDEIFKYHLTLNGGEIDFSDFITLLKDQKKEFFQAFQGALKDANSKFPGYF